VHKAVLVLQPPVFKHLHSFTDDPVANIPPANTMIAVMLAVLDIGNQILEQESVFAGLMAMANSENLEAQVGKHKGDSIDRFAIFSDHDVSVSALLIFFVFFPVAPNPMSCLSSSVRPPKPFPMPPRTRSAAGALWLRDFRSSRSCTGRPSSHSFDRGSSTRLLLRLSFL
jgi:hypothetical protein